jgi:polar amino acid transport system substrate-binding protein
MRVLAVLLVAAPAAAQPPLRWGADKNGGGPFVYEDAGRLVGFEAELADYLAGAVGRKAAFVQNQWDNVPELLKRPNQGRADDIDIALNGFEYGPDRHAESPTTLPYFVYTFRLIGRRDDPTVSSWAALAGGDTRKSVGVLRGTAAQRYLEARYGDRIDLKPSETVDEMLGLVADGRVDATVQDSPAAVFYVNQGRYPTLWVVDEPVGTGYYVALCRPGDDQLREGLNAAIKQAVRSGWLKAVYQRYGIWDAAQQRLYYLVEQPWPEAAAEAGPAVADPGTRPTVRFAQMLPNLVRAAGMTVLLAVSSFPLAVLLGLIVAVGRVYGPWPVRFLLGVYVEVLRGTPLLLQLFVIYYLIPQVAVLTGVPWLIELLTLPPFAAAVLGLGLNYSAAEAENYRAGLLGVPRGQMEAALALGLTRATAVRRVVLPQAVRLVIPPVTNDFIALFKDTAICSTILIVELTGLYYQYKTYPGVVVELAAAVAVLYLLMSYPLSLAARWLERRTAVHGGRP